MKKILILINSLFVFGIANAQASNTENYIQSRTYLEPVTISSSTAKQLETIQYIDGLGNSKQIVNVKASPTGKDLVTTIPYDGFGRQVDSWLPAPMTTLNGGIQSAVDAAAQTYHNDNRPFTHQNIENSPLDRVLSQAQTGTAWQTHPVNFDYSTNVDGEVKKYIATFDYATFTSNLVTGTPYGNNQLYKNSVTDEDGNQTIEFKNGQGQTILVRKMLNTTESADTYYIYNDYDQLAYVIPPNAADALKNLGSGVTISATDPILTGLCYQYKYDGKNRLVEKKLPGKGWEQIIYNKRGQVVYYRDANLKIGINGFVGDEAWTFTKYDKFGRPVYTGICRDGTPRQTIQSAVDGQSIDYEVRGGTLTMNGMTIEYGNSTYPVSIDKITSVNYYDTYPAGSPAIPSSILGQTLLSQDAQNSSISTKSLPTASYVKNIEDDNWTKNYSYYDTKGRVIGTHSINHLGGYTKNESELDFAGVIKKTITRHKRLNTDTEKVITENFEYDNQNRLLVHKHQVDNNTEEILTQNKYNELSQLESKKVGGTNVATPLQSIDYAYNIRGWMTKINDPANLTNGKLFGYEMRYQNPLTDLWMPKYNGNISEIDWKTSQDGIQRRYVYMYDSINRLTGGFYLEPNSSIIWAGYYSEYSHYDLNGNITQLTRMGKADSQTTASVIDDLTYVYTGNKLTSVSDTSQNPSSYPLGGNTISYDNNGNMTSHMDKEINEIDYNFLNLPSTIKTRPGTKTAITNQYIYRADGVKVSKSRRTSSIQAPTILYLDGFQYSISDGQLAGTELQFVPTAEGYYDFQQNKYIYNYVDHLGNVRLSYTKSGSGTEIIEENNYYPFGLKHEGYNTLSGNSKYNYKYNGKELQETGMYDYGARFYMPDLGRWGVVDPMAEKSRRWSPYNYVFNNPLRFIDPDGRKPNDIIFNFFDVSSGQYREYARIKSEKYDMNVNISAPYPVQGISLAPDDSQRKTYGDYRGISGQYQFDELASAHGNPDAISVGLGANLALGKGFGAGASVALMMKGIDQGKAGLYATGNSLEGAEASVGIQVSFMYSDISLSQFNLKTLEGYGEGAQLGVGPVGASKFESYSGEYKYTWNYENYYIPKRTFVKDQLLYHGYSYGLGVGPEDVSASSSTFTGDTKYLMELTNLIKPK
ncbi:DUF6443 domain-containing protein [Chryseobacterium soldanellicola]|nr:DUF6443 domain-containing protein [Chryseobacterium soldanellicola]